MNTNNSLCTFCIAAAAHWSVWASPNGRPRHLFTTEDHVEATTSNNESACRFVVPSCDSHQTRAQICSR